MSHQFARPEKRGRVLSSSGPLVLDSGDVVRALRRISHEVLERNRGADGVIVVGIASGGIWVGEIIAEILSEISGLLVPFFPLDVSDHRDDLERVPGHGQEKSVALINGRTILLVDDVLYTGRTARAALDALTDFGRPAAVQLAVLVDRGHRELPIRADFVGKNLPTSRQEFVMASTRGVQIGSLDV